MCFEDGTEKRAGTMSPNARTSQWHNDMQHTSYACVLSSGLLAFIQQRRHSHLNDDDNVPLLVEAEEMASFQVTISHTSPYHSSTHHCLCWTSCRKEPARHDPVKWLDYCMVPNFQGAQFLRISWVILQPWNLRSAKLGLIDLLYVYS